MAKKPVLFLAVFSVVTLLSACDTMPKRAELGEGIRSTIQQNDVKHALLVTKDGRIIPVDSTGKTMHRCDVSEKDTTCRGLVKATVHDLQSITVIKSTVNPYCITYIMLGQAYEDCWNIN